MIQRNRLSLRIAQSRMEKLRRISASKEKTMTQMIESWIDQLKED